MNATEMNHGVSDWVISPNMGPKRIWPSSYSHLAHQMVHQSRRYVPWANKNRWREACGKQYTIEIASLVGSWLPCGFAQCTVAICFVVPGLLRVVIIFVVKWFYYSKSVYQIWKNDEKWWQSNYKSNCLSPPNSFCIFMCFFNPLSNSIFGSTNITGDPI